MTRWFVGPQEGRGTDSKAGVQGRGGGRQQSKKKRAHRLRLAKPTRAPKRSSSKPPLTRSRKCASTPRSTSATWRRHSALGCGLRSCVRGVACRMRASLLAVMVSPLLRWRSAGGIGVGKGRGSSSQEQQQSIRARPTRAKRTCTCKHTPSAAPRRTAARAAAGSRPPTSTCRPPSARQTRPFCVFVCDGCCWCVDRGSFTKAL